MKYFAFKLTAFAVLAVASTCASYGYVIKDVIVSSYNFKQDRMAVALHGRTLTVATPNTRFFAFCDGSVRMLTEQEAARRLHSGSRVRLDVVWRNGKAVATRVVLMPRA